MLTSSRFFLSVFLFALVARGSESNQWTSIDMGGGAYNMVVKAGLLGTVIVGSDLSGAYISTNRGTSWSCIGSVQGLTMCHISAIGFDPNDANVIVLGGNGGLYRSTNGGSTFSQVHQNGYFTDIAFARSNSQIAFAAGDPSSGQYNQAASRVFKSSDNGISWTALSTPAGLKITKIVVHPSNPEIVYIVSGPQRFVSGPQVLYQSLNGGTNWAQFAGSVTNVLDFELDPSNPSQVMYLSSFAFTPNYWKVPRLSTDGLWKSTNGGVTWTQKTTNNIWGVIHIKPGVVRVFSDYNAYESADGGDTWTWKGGQSSWSKAGGFSWFYGSFEPDSQGNDLSNPDRYYWVNSLWVFGTSDGGAHFKSLYTREDPPGSNRWRNTGIKNTCVWQVRVSEANPNVVYAAFWDMGLWRSLDHGDTWESCNNLDFSGNWTEPLVKGTRQGIGGNARSIVADPTLANVVWVTVGGDQNQRIYLLKSTNYGRFDSWQPASGLPDTSDLMGLSLDRHSPVTNRTLFCTANGSVFRSTDGGMAWSLVISNAHCQYTQVDSANSDYVYAGGDGGLLRSTNHGNAGSWTKVGLPEMTSVKAIRCDPSNPAWIYVACYGDGNASKGLYRSKDRGNTWQKILSDYFLRDVAVDPKNPNKVYAASSSNETWGWYDPRSKGFFYSRDGGATWTQANEGLSWPFAATIDIDAKDPFWIFLGAPGLGFQRRHFAE